MYVGGPRSNRTLNLAPEIEVVVRCAARCCRPTQYPSSLPRGINLGCLLSLLWLFFFKCMLGSSAIFMMADNKEQRVCVKFCFLLGKSAAETVLMLQEAFKEESLSRTQVYEWYSRFKGGEMSREDQPRSGRPSTC